MKISVRGKNAYVIGGDCVYRCMVFTYLLIVFIKQFSVYFWHFFSMGQSEPMHTEVTRKEQTKCSEKMEVFILQNKSYSKLTTNHCNCHFQGKN